MYRPEVSKYVGTRLYNIYNNMILRCTNPNATNYERYGGRGITVCKEWSGKRANINFFRWAEQTGYTDELTLDRIDNSKGYSPENCRWVLPKIQNRNKRNNVYLTLDGKTQILEDWAKELKIDSRVLRSRMKRGWSDYEVLKTPLHKKGTPYRRAKEEMIVLPENNQMNITDFME